MKKLLEQIQNKFFKIPENLYYEDSLYEEIASKKNTIRKSNSISEIVVGSSQGNLGFIPNIFSSSCFNLCSTSQDLYYSFKLAEYYLNRIKTLNRVFLFYADFSPGFEVQKSSDKLISALYCLLYGFPPMISNDRDLENFKWWFYLKTLIDPIKVASKLDYRGYKEQFTNFSGDYLLKRANNHLKHNKRNNNQTQFLEEMLKLGAEFSLVVVIGPTRKDYRDLLPDKEFLFRELYSLQKRHMFKILDFYADDSFLSDDFQDADHLNHNGARKLTLKIKELLN
jgi:hypothetical protein